MLLCPIQNTAVFEKITWLQKRPRITQRFGENPKMYEIFKLKGHNGLDFGIPEGTELFAPCSGTLRTYHDHNGYGTYIIIKNDQFKVYLAHLSEVITEVGGKVEMGQKIALSGNTGFSIGPHLHITIKELDGNGHIRHRLNGYNGAIDPLPLLITWKGGLDTFNL